MKTNRDLLVLIKDSFEENLSMESTLQQLNEMLYHFETTESFCTANEIIDMNRYKIYNKADKILKVLKQPSLKPFQFVCNKN